MSEGIETWLAGLGLGRYARAFVDNDIDAQVLPHLTSEDLAELGVASIGHRRRILSAARAATAASGADGERRQLTVLFCDLVGSATIAQNHDPEDVQALLSAYHRFCDEVISRFGGQVANYMGDGVVAAFGYPRARRDDAVRAVEAGLALARPGGALTLAGGPPPGVRVGVDAGLVVVGGAGAEARVGNLSIFGEVPNRAARVQSLAGPGTVWVTDAVLSLARGGFAAQDRGRHALKGFDAPQQVWEIAGPRRAAPAAGTRPLIGRGPEIAAVRAVWAEVRDGVVRRVHIRGESGLGKSRVLAAAVEALDPAPAAIWSGSGAADQANTAFGVVLRLVADRAGLTPGQPAEEVAPRLRDWLGLPDADDPLPSTLAGLIAGQGTADGPVPAPDFGARLREVLARRLAADCAAGPTVLRIDDVEQCDPSSADLLRDIVADLPDAPLMWVTAGETEPPPDRAPHVSVTLEPLPDDAIREILRAEQAGRGLDDGVIDRIVARAEGVPVFAAEFARLSDGRVGTEGDPAVPATLQELLLARIDGLGAARPVALAAAIIGREFDAPVLQEITGLAPEALRSALDSLEASGVVRRRGTTGFAFRHGLVHAMAHDVQLNRSRQAMHAKVAAVLERDPGGPDTEAVARHYELAQRHREAAFRWQAVAERQIALGGYREALAALDRARACLAQAGDGADLRRLELKMLAARGATLIALRPQAAGDIRQVYEEAHALSRTLAPMRETVPVLFGLAVQAYFRGELSRTERVCRELVALQDTLDLPIADTVGAHLMITQVAFWRGDHAAVGAVMSGLAPGDPRRLQAGDDDQRKMIPKYAQVPSVTSRITHVWSLNLTGRLRQAVDELAAVRAQAERLDHPYSIAQSCQIAAWFHFTRGEPGPCLDWAGKLGDLAAAHGLGMFHDLVDVLRLWAEARLGLRPGAAREAEAIADRMFRSGAQLGMGPIAVLVADAALATGEPGVAAGALRRALTESHSEETVYLPELLRLRTEVARLGEPDTPDPHDDLGRAIDLARRQGAHLLALRSALARCRVPSGPDGAARDLLDACLSAIPEPDDIPDLRAARRILDRSQSTLAPAQGDPT